jgi:hypothetical protein
MPKDERTLESIIRQAQRLRPQSEDEPMYHLMGGIIANAEDALESLRSDRRMAALVGMFR